MASACVSDEDRIRANACSARYDLFEVVDRDDCVIKRQANERIICRDVVRRNWLDGLNRMEGAEMFHLASSEFLPGALRKRLRDFLGWWKNQMPVEFGAS